MTVFKLNLQAWNSRSNVIWMNEILNVFIFRKNVRLTKFSSENVWNDWRKPAKWCSWLSRRHQSCQASFDLQPVQPRARRWWLLQGDRSRAALPLIRHQSSNQCEICHVRWTPQTTRETAKWVKNRLRQNWI